MKTISDRIFELIKERGMSQKYFSEKTGIAQSSLYNQQGVVCYNLPVSQHWWCKQHGKGYNPEQIAEILEEDVAVIEPIYAEIMKQQNN